MRCSTALALWPSVARRFQPGPGTLARSRWVQGCSGWSRIRAVGPRSTTVPRCSTSVSSVSWRTTARSWLIRMYETWVSSRAAPAPVAGGPGRPGPVVPAGGDGPAGGLLQADDHPSDRGLARTGLPDDGQRPATHEDEGDIVHGDERAEVLAQPGHLEDRRAGALSHRAAPEAGREARAHGRSETPRRPVRPGRARRPGRRRPRTGREGASSPAWSRCCAAAPPPGARTTTCPKRRWSTPWPPGTSRRPAA